jgi:hypothetical protein
MEGSIIGTRIDPQESSNKADLVRMLAKQDEDETRRFFGREKLLDGSVTDPSRPHFQLGLVLDIAIPIRFAFPPGHHQHLMGLRVIVQDFQNRPADLSTPAATLGNLCHAVSKNPSETQLIEPAGHIGQPTIHAIGTTMSKRHGSYSFA